MMKAWDDTWKTAAGRDRWSTPDPLVVELIPRFQQEGVRTVLDLGFGVGRHAIVCAEAGFEVYGLDASASGLTYARRWAAQEGVELRLQTGDMAALPFSGDFFDLILTWNVIYHGGADYVRRTITEIKRCLKPEGYLLCTLMSTANEHYGKGQEVEPNTFVVPGAHEKSHPHHYFDRAAIDRYLCDFNLLRCEDVEQDGPGSFHWQLLARLTKGL